MTKIGLLILILLALLCVGCITHQADPQGTPNGALRALIDAIDNDREEYFINHLISPNYYTEGPKDQFHRQVFRGMKSYWPNYKKFSKARQAGTTEQILFTVPPLTSYVAFEKVGDKWKVLSWSPDSRHDVESATAGDK